MIDLLNSNDALDAIVAEKPKTLREMIHKIDNLYDYLKYIKPGHSNKVTGKRIDMKFVDDDLIVVDFDHIKDLRKLEGELCDFVTERTPSGKGFHVYVKQGSYTPSNARETKIEFEGDSGYDIDVFSKSTGESGVTLEAEVKYEVEVKDNDGKVHKETYIGKSEWLNGDLDSVIDLTFDDLIEILGISIKPREPKNTTHHVATGECPVTKDELLNICKEFKGVTVHGDQGNCKITDKISQFSIKSAIYAFPDEEVQQEALDIIKSVAKLTDKADSRWDEERAQPSDVLNLWRMLGKEVPHPVIPNDECEAFLNKPLPPPPHIDLHDNSIDEFKIIKKIGDNKYTNDDELLFDCMKVFAYVTSGAGFWIQKEYNPFIKAYNFSFVTRSEFISKLKSIKYKKSNVYTAVIEPHLASFTHSHVSFNSVAEGVFKIFGGYKYQNVHHEDQDANVDEFIKFVHDVIANGDEKVYDYIMNWVSFIVQKPGVKTETGIILRGDQGTGKTTFTDTLSEMFAGYSEPNINDIKDITGEFNERIENKVLIVANELKNFGEERLSNFDDLKSKLTDKTYLVGGKYKPKHFAENVNNYIFVSNNVAPIKIESKDRRYVVCDCSNIHRCDTKYFKIIHDMRCNDFYENLMYRLSNRDISEWNSREIPMTEAKKEMIALTSVTKFDDWVIAHLKELETGMLTKDAEESCIAATGSKLANVRTNLKKICDNVKCCKGELRNKHIYTIKPESLKHYKELNLNDDDDDETVEVADTI